MAAGLGRSAGQGSSEHKLMLIAIDSADHDFIAANANLLPNISRMLAAGAGGGLHSEPLAGAVWPSFLTASRPGAQAGPGAAQGRCGGP
jgi:predicted AlkP superfamily phosphohydrolase/phosphomutase